MFGSSSDDKKKEQSALGKKVRTGISVGVMAAGNVADSYKGKTPDPVDTWGRREQAETRDRWKSSKKGKNLSD